MAQKRNQLSVFHLGSSIFNCVIKSRLKSTITQDLESQILHRQDIVTIMKQNNNRNHWQLQHDKQHKQAT